MARPHHRGHNLKLSHFTSLVFLPAILRDGLTKGEVPLRPGKALNAANFTSNPNPHALHWAVLGPLDKSRVRLEVDVPDDRLEPWRAAMLRLKVNKGYMRDLDTQGQGKFWYFYWGTVLPSRILSVDVREGQDYRPRSGSDLDALIADINTELLHLEFGRREDGVPLIRRKDGTRKSWLYDGNPNYQSGE
jgi:hypothetical protein